MIKAYIAMLYYMYTLDRITEVVLLGGEIENGLAKLRFNGR